jgi:hypothetical protein
MEVQVAGMQSQLSDNFFDLVPGKPRTIIVDAPQVATAKDLLVLLRFGDLSRVLGE